MTYKTHLYINIVALRHFLYMIALPSSFLALLMYNRTSNTSNALEYSYKYILLNYYVIVYNNRIYIHCLI